MTLWSAPALIRATSVWLALSSWGIFIFPGFLGPFRALSGPLPFMQESCPQAKSLVVTGC